MYVNNLSSITTPWKLYAPTISRCQHFLAILLRFSKTLFNYSQLSTFIRYNTLLARFVHCWIKQASSSHFHLCLFWLIAIQLLPNLDRGPSSWPSFQKFLCPSAIIQCLTSSVDLEFSFAVCSRISSTSVFYKYHLLLFFTNNISYSISDSCTKKNRSFHFALHCSLLVNILIRVRVSAP